MKLTENFSRSEFERSSTATRHGIDNKIPTELMNNVTNLANVLEVVRLEINRKCVTSKVLRITSGYRCKKLNRKIGGSKYSQHMKGEAADFVVPGMHPRVVFEIIKENVCASLIDQCILEYGKWIHLSTKLDGDNRGEFLDFEEDES